MGLAPFAVLSMITMAPKLLIFFFALIRCTDLVKVWNETEQYLKEHQDELDLKGKVKSYKWDSAFTTEPSDKMITPRVVDRDTISAALDILKQDNSKKVMVVAFANNDLPGGFYAVGAEAQEEDIYRRTTISRIMVTSKISMNFYPINRPNGTVRGLYTPGVRILRKSEHEGFGFFELTEKYLIDVCSIAALNGNDPTDNWYFGDGMTWSTPRVLNSVGTDLTRKRNEVMFQMALTMNADVLIVGAFGCGMFANIPEQIVDLFNEVLYTYRFAKLEVVFAVMGEPNLSIFRNNIAKDLANKPAPVFRVNQGGMPTVVSGISTPRQKDPAKFTVPWFVVAALGALFIIGIIALWYLKWRK